MRKIIVLVIAALLLVPSASLPGVSADAPDGKYFRVRTKAVGGGRILSETLISGPPDPPPGYLRARAEPPVPSVAAGVNSLSDVPAFDWSFGCSATSAAMIAGYYDRTGYPNMYAGPTNGGVMPLDNSSWGYWSDGTNSRAQCPLSATRLGLDERTTKGHVDDYWIVYGNAGPDPFIGNWPEHAYGDCTGDYMRTNQSTYGNVDAGTTFWNYTSGNPLHCSSMPGGGIDNDGGYGLMEFYQSRGYSVTACYNQYIQGQGSNPLLGFTYDQYKAEIDAGRPVMFHVQGHTMVGIGYDDATDLMYIHDTWDYSVHTMTWGGSYSGMLHYAVTIVQLAPIVDPPAAPTNLVATKAGPDEIDLTWTDNSTDETGFGIERSPDGSSWTLIGSVGANTAGYSDTGLVPGTTHYRVYAYNGAGNSAYSNEANASTDDDPPSVTITDPTGGAIVSGSVSIVADAIDDAGVNQVEFFAGGSSIGVDTIAGDGWSVSWDTTAVIDGGYTVNATATDTAFQTGSDSINVTVQNADTTPPDPPNGLGATGGDGFVDLAWSANGESDLAGYTVHRSTTSGGPYAPLTGSLLTQASYTDNAVSNGTTYHYVVTASDDSDNESGYSGEASATPQVPADEDVASADYATTYGTVAGTYQATQTQDDAYQSITEESTDDRVNKRYDLLEQIWQFDLTSGNHVLNVDAHYVDAGDGDSGFDFFWSSSPSGDWSYLLTVEKTADDDAYQKADVGSASGTIYVRAVDNDRSRRQYQNDTLHVDCMYVDGGTPPVPPDPATSPDPSHEATDISMSPTLSWTAGARAESHDVYLGTDSEPGFHSSQAGTSFSPSDLDPETTYYWRIDEVNGAGTATGVVWSFRTMSLPDPPDPATNPNPANGATDATKSPTLNWTAGARTESHNVYFGTDPTPGFQGNQTGTSFSPGALASETTHYWRIDETNGGGTTTGTVWSFTTMASVEPQTMHVHSIVPSTVRGSKGRMFGQATVVVVDDQGGYVGAATVVGTFMDSYSETLSDLTDASGVAVITTGTETKKPAFQFCVSDITHAGLTYAPGDNNVTCASYP